MKTLLFLRHAKSSWKDPSLQDEERPLNSRGRLAAPKMGELLRTLQLVPDQVLCSTAVRAESTCRAVCEASHFEGPTTYLPELYLASAETLLATAATHGEATASRVMLIGHNPGMENIVSRLCGRLQPFPTAALAAFRFDVSEWSALSDQSPAEMLGVWLPRELD